MEELRVWRGNDAADKTVSVGQGNGNGEHPTQALLDLFTIYDELLERSDINIFIWKT